MPPYRPGREHVAAHPGVGDFARRVRRSAPPGRRCPARRGRPRRAWSGPRRAFRSTTSGPRSPRRFDDGFGLPGASLRGIARPAGSWRVPRTPGTPWPGCARTGRGPVRRLRWSTSVRRSCTGRMQAPCSTARSRTTSRASGMASRSARVVFLVLVWVTSHPRPGRHG